MRAELFSMPWPYRDIWAETNCEKLGWFHHKTNLANGPFFFWKHKPFFSSVRKMLWALSWSLLFFLQENRFFVILFFWRVKKCKTFILGKTDSLSLSLSLCVCELEQILWMGFGLSWKKIDFVSVLTFSTPFCGLIRKDESRCRECTKTAVSEWISQWQRKGRLLHRIRVFTPMYIQGFLRSQSALYRKNATVWKKCILFIDRKGRKQTAKAYRSITLLLQTINLRRAACSVLCDFDEKKRDENTKHFVFSPCKSPWQNHAKFVVCGLLEARRKTVKLEWQRYLLHWANW